MKRGLWLIFAALVMIAATVLFRYDPEPVAAIESSPAAPTPPDAVRVSHEFVTVPIPVPAKAADPEGTTRSRTKLATNRPAVPRSRDALKASNRTTGPPVRHPARDRNLLERAGRAFIGDGKYRPEPFPRVR